MDLSHVAVFLDDINSCSLLPAMGGWGGPLTEISKQPVTAGGCPDEHTGRTRRLRTDFRSGFGVSVEDVAATAPIQPIPGNAWHHVAVWCDDIPATVRALEARGYEKHVVGRDADGALATFAYMISAQGPRIEISDRATKKRIVEHFTKVAAQYAEGASPLFYPSEVATVVESRQALEDLQAAWSDALGAAWSECTERTTKVVAPNGEQILRTLSVKTLRDPHVTIIASDSNPLLAPVGAGGWHHVSFTSEDIGRDVAAFERLGIQREFWDRGENGRPGSFAMMRTQEGTRVKLTQSQG